MSEVPVSAPVALESAAPVEAAPSAEPKAPEPRKYKLKVDGEDWEPSEDEVKKFAQIGRAKEKRFEESSRMRKEAESLKERLKSDWVGTLRELGVDPRDVSEKFLGEQLRHDMMSPEQKEAFERDNENKSLKQKLADIESQKEQERYEKDQREYEAQLEKDIPVALEKAGLPRSPATLKRIANQLLNALEGGYDMSVEEAAELVSVELKSDLNHLLSVAGKFDDLIPATVAEKLMQSHLAKVKSAPTFKPQGTEAPATPAPKKTYTEAEWRKMFN